MRVLILFFGMVLLVSCGAANKKFRFDDGFRIGQDSVLIITPNIEIKEVAILYRKYINAPNERKELSDLVIESMERNVPRSIYKHIPFMLEDSYTINGALEREVNYKVEPAPDEVLVESEKKSIYISMNCYFGKLKKVVFNAFIIDNVSGNWKLMDHSIHQISPLNSRSMNNLLDKKLKIIVEADN